MGAAVAVSLGAGSVLVASAAVTSGVRSVFVPITPCRLFDSRPGDINVGPRATPLGAGEIARFPARGIAGRCTIPADAVGLQLNVTVLNGTAASYLTVWAAGDTQPLASSLNWMSGQAPTPNAVTSAVSASGEISLFNQSGSVDVLADVVGYYADHNFDDRYYTREQVDAILLAAGGNAGPIGPVGPQGPIGPQGAPGAPGGAEVLLSPSQLAQLRWDLDPGRPLTIPVGTAPRGVAFDGTNIWITNSASNNVTKVNGTTGAVVGTYPVGLYPFGVAFDGTSIWVSNRDSHSLTKLHVATGAIVGTVTFGPGTDNYGLVFDGTHLWTNDNSFGLYRVNPATETFTSYSLGGSGTSFGLAFDGRYLWVPGYNDDVVSRVDTTNPAAPPLVLIVGHQPYTAAFDGENVWVTNGGSDTVSKITNISSGTPTVTSLAAGSAPRGIVFDGESIWVADYSSGVLSKFDIRLNTRVDIPSGTTTIRTMAFDGHSLWLVSGDGNHVRRLRN